eukprot:s178_g17.t1
MEFSQPFAGINRAGNNLEQLAVKPISQSRHIFPHLGSSTASKKRYQHQPYMFKALEERIEEEIVSGSVSDVFFGVGPDEETHLFSSRANLAMASPVFHAMFFGPQWHKEAGRQSPRKQRWDHDGNKTSSAPSSPKSHAAAPTDPWDKCSPRTYVTEQLQFRPGQHHYVAVPDIEPSAFRCMLRYVHHLDPLLCLDNAMQVYRAADKYQIFGLLEACGTFIDEHVDPSNVTQVLTLFDVACRMGLERYSQTFLQILEQLSRVQTRQVLQANEFLELHSVSLATLLGSDGLCVHEELLWTAIRSWAEVRAMYKEQSAEPEATGCAAENKPTTVAASELVPSWQDAIRPLRHLIRFPAMSAAFFAKEISKSGVLSHQEVVEIFGFLAQKACLAWRSCGSLLGPLHSIRGAPSRAVEILRLAVCELSDLVERCGDLPSQPVAAGGGASGEPSESEEKTEDRRKSKEARGVEKGSSPVRRSRRESGDRKSEKRADRGDRPEHRQSKPSPVRKEASQSSAKEKRKTKDRSERTEEKVKKRKRREELSQSPAQDRPARPAQPRSPSHSPTKAKGERRQAVVKEELQSEEEGPTAPPGKWVLKDAPTSYRSSTASQSSVRLAKPPEPPGPPPGWGPSAEGGAHKRPAAAEEAVVRRGRRRPAGEAEVEAEEPPAPVRISPEEAFSSFKRGEEIEACSLAPGALARGEWISVLQGSYFQQKASFAFKLEKEELDGGDRELCGVLTGTDSEPLLRFATGNKPCHIQVHLCPPECAQLRENPNLLHARKIKRILPDAPLTWENNLIEEGETSLLQAEAEDWRKKKEAERKEKKRRSSSTSPSTKKKKKRKKKKKKEEKPEEGELKTPGKGRLGGKSVAKKPLASLFYGTGLDPSGKNRKKIIKRLKKSLKKTRDSSSSTGSSTTSTSSEAEDTEVLEDRSKLQKIATRAPGVLAAQGIRNMLEYLHQYSGTNWEMDTQQLPPVLCQYHRTYLMQKLSGGVGREAATLSWIGDLVLQGRASEAMDCLLQRLKSEVGPTSAAPDFECGERKREDQGERARERKGERPWKGQREQGEACRLRRRLDEEARYKTPRGVEAEGSAGELPRGDEEKRQRQERQEVRFDHQKIPQSLKKIEALSEEAYADQTKEVATGLDTPARRDAMRGCRVEKGWRKAGLRGKTWLTLKRKKKSRLLLRKDGDESERRGVGKLPCGSAPLASAAATAECPGFCTVSTASMQIETESCDLGLGQDQLREKQVETTCPEITLGSICEWLDSRVDDFFTQHCKTMSTGRLFPLPSSPYVLSQLFPQVTPQVRCVLRVLVLGLNSLNGEGLEGPGEASEYQVKVLSGLLEDCNRVSGWVSKDPDLSWKAFFRVKGVDYKGEEVLTAQHMRWENVAPALPLEVGSVPLEQVLDYGCKHYVLNFEDYLLDPSDQVAVKPPRVMVPPEDWDQFCSNLLRLGVFGRVHEDEIPRIKGQRLLNGLFGVSKHEYAGTTEIMRVIMNMIPVNSVVRGIEGDVSTLPSWAGMAPLHLQPHEQLVVSSEDVRAFFYIFRIPKNWHPYLAFNRPLSPELGGEKAGLWYPCSAVLPMGFKNSVSLAQAVHRFIVNRALRNVPSQSSESELRKDRPFSTANPLHRIYLDNFDELEKTSAETAKVISGQVSALTQSLQETYLALGVPRHPKKGVARQLRAEVQGAIVDGELGLAFPKPEKVLRYMQLAKLLLEEGYSTQKQMQIVGGGLVYLAMFRRPLLGGLNHVWQFILDCEGYPPVVRFRIPHDVQHELARFLGLVPLAYMNFRCQLSEIVTASDASEKGGGITASCGLTPMGVVASDCQIRGDVMEPEDIPGVLTIGLFDGIGALRVAADALGWNVLGHISVEKSKEASRVVESQFPNTLLVANVEEVDHEMVRSWAQKYSQIALVVLGAGPPCQGVSGLNAARKGALRDERSSLFVHVDRIRSLVKQYFPWAQVKSLMENVASMDQADEDVMSASFGDAPWFIDASGLSLAHRPRLYWVDWEFTPHPDVKIGTTSIGRKSVSMNVELDDAQFLTPGWKRCTVGKFPTFTTSRPRDSPGYKPAGLHQCNVEELAAWKADKHRFPPYQYQRKDCVENKRGVTRLPSIQEREVMMGFPKDFTANCLPKAEQQNSYCTDVRLSLIGNSWNVSVVAWLLSQLGSLLGLNAVLSPEEIVQRTSPGCTANLQTFLRRPPMVDVKCSDSPNKALKLVTKLCTMVSLKGEDLLLQSATEDVTRYHRLRASIPARLWAWKTVASLTKAGKRQGAAESVTIHSADVCRRLFQWKSCASPETLLCGAAHKWRKQFADVVSAVGFQDFDYRPYSLRRGGATHLFQVQGRFDALLVLGRWQAASTARIYINSGLAVLAEISIPWNPFIRNLRSQYLAGLTKPLAKLELTNQRSQIRGRWKRSKKFSETRGAEKGGLANLDPDSADEDYVRVGGVYRADSRIPRLGWCMAPGQSDPMLSEEFGLTEGRELLTSVGPSVVVDGRGLSASSWGSSVILAGPGTGFHLAFGTRGFNSGRHAWTVSWRPMDCRQPALGRSRCSRGGAAGIARDIDGLSDASRPVVERTTSASAVSASNGSTAATSTGTGQATKAAAVTVPLSRGSVPLPASMAAGASPASGTEEPSARFLDWPSCIVFGVKRDVVTEGRYVAWEEDLSSTDVIRFSIVLDFPSRTITYIADRGERCWSAALTHDGPVYPVIAASGPHFFSIQYGCHV